MSELTICEVPGCDFAARPGITFCQGHIPLGAASVAYQDALRAPSEPLTAEERLREALQAWLHSNVGDNAAEERLAEVGQEWLDAAREERGLDEELERLRPLSKAASSGPWTLGRSQTDGPWTPQVWPRSGAPIASADGRPSGRPGAPEKDAADFAFIVEAVNYIRRVLAQPSDD